MCFSLARRALFLRFYLTALTHGKDYAPYLTANPDHLGKILDIRKSLKNWN